MYPGVFQYCRPVNSYVYMSFTDTYININIYIHLYLYIHIYTYTHVNSRNIYYKARCQEGMNESYEPSVFRGMPGQDDW